MAVIANQNSSWTLIFTPSRAHTGESFRILNSRLHIIFGDLMSCSVEAPGGNVGKAAEKVFVDLLEARGLENTLTQEIDQAPLDARQIYFGTGDYQYRHCTDVLSASRIAADLIVKFSSCHCCSTDALPIPVKEIPECTDFSRELLMDIPMDGSLVWFPGGWELLDQKCDFFYRGLIELVHFLQERPIQRVYCLTRHEWLTKLAVLAVPSEIKVYVINDGNWSTLEASRTKSQRWAAIDKLSEQSTFALVLFSLEPSYVRLFELLVDVCLKLGIRIIPIFTEELSPTKLANYHDLDAVIVVGCPQIIFSPGFFWPLLSPHEFLCVLKIAHFWNQPHVIEAEALCNQLLHDNSDCCSTDSPYPTSNHTSLEVVESLQTTELIRLKDMAACSVPIVTSDDNIEVRSVEIIKGKSGLPEKYSDIN